MLERLCHNCHNLEIYVYARNCIVNWRNEHDTIYMACDWGDLAKGDKGLNDEAVKSGSDRILAAFPTSKGKIYIITEWNRKYTTVLFPNEY